MVLTCGYCVYNRDNGVWNDTYPHRARHDQDNTNTTVIPLAPASRASAPTPRGLIKYRPSPMSITAPLGFVCPFEVHVHSLVFDYEPAL